MQFPLRPVYSDCPNITSANYKPNNNILELDVPYDPSIFSGDSFERPSHQKMISSKIDQTTYLNIAVIRNGELHVTPVQKIFQIKPSFNRLASREITEDMSDDEDEESDKKASNIQQVRKKLVSVSFSSL